MVGNIDSFKILLDDYLVKPSLVLFDTLSLYKYGDKYFYELREHMNVSEDYIEYVRDQLIEVQSNPFKYLKDNYYAELSKLLIKESLKVSKMLVCYKDLITGDNISYWMDL